MADEVMNLKNEGESKDNGEQEIKPKIKYK